MDSNYAIITDPDNNSIVCINDIRFKGKRKINWDEIEEYLRQYIGKFYENADTKDVIYIGREFPDEYAGSNDTARLMGTLAKAKANASQGIPQLIQTATNPRFKENLAVKHEVDAKYGWK